MYTAVYLGYAGPHTYRGIGHRVYVDCYSSIPVQVFLFVALTFALPFSLSLSRDTTTAIVKVRKPPREDLRCVVHDRVWVYHDILLVSISPPHASVLVLPGGGGVAHHQRTTTSSITIICPQQRSVMLYELFLTFLYERLPIHKKRKVFPLLCVWVRLCSVCGRGTGGAVVNLYHPEHICGSISRGHEVVEVVALHSLNPCHRSPSYCAG